MNYEDLIWINQKFYSYQDKYYQSDGKLEISVNTCTSNMLDFNPPKFQFIIYNNGQMRTCSLTYPDIIDLLGSLKGVTNSLESIYSNPQSGDITKSYKKDQQLTFEFRKDQSTGDRLVVIKLTTGNYDEGKVIIPLIPDYFCIGNLVKDFKESYMKFCLDVPNRFLLSQLLQATNQVSNSITTLPSVLGKIKNYEEPEIEVDPETIATTNEFHQFAEDNEENVRIPEIEETPVTQEVVTQEYHSVLLDEILKGDIEKFDQIISAIYPNENPFLSFIDLLNKHKQEDYLPGISDKELKSVSYISTLLFKIYLKSYLDNNEAIPASTKIVSCNVKGTTQFNTELAYDLLLLMTYLKIFRSKIEAVNSDAFENKSIIYLATRLITDPLIFSFIKDQKHDVIKNGVITRFKHYNNNGFFSNYNIILDRNSCKPIVDQEICQVCNAICEKAIPTITPILDLHKNIYEQNTVVLPPENDFTIEQITNDIINLEIQVKFGTGIESITEDSRYTSLFVKKSTPRKNIKHKERNEKTTNVVRWCNLNKHEIPERLHDEFFTYINELNYGDYEFFSKFPEEEFGETIIKGLYVWNESDKKMTYSNYALRIEECISKDLIMSKLKELETLDSEEINNPSNEWTNLTELAGD